MSSSQLLDYEVLASIGTGNFGSCFRVRSRITGKLFVWKAIDYGIRVNSTNLQQLLSEISALKQLAHPNIVRYFNHIIASANNDESRRMLYIIMECCEGGDLAAQVQRCRRERQRFEEPFVWRCAIQLARALHACHAFSAAVSVLHCDIKPANVFLDAAGNVKLGDFGLARWLYHNNDYTNDVVEESTAIVDGSLMVGGTPFYQSPEVGRGRRYTNKSDVWSLGCLVYELCTLRPPFDGKNVAALRRNIVDGRFERIPVVYSGELQRIISQMLSTEADRRPTIEMLLHNPTGLARLAGIEATFPILVPDERLSATGNNAPVLDEWFTPKPDLSSTRIDAADGSAESATTLFEENYATAELRRQLFGASVAHSVDGMRSEPGEVCLSRRNTNHGDLKKTVSEGVLHRHGPISDPAEITQEVFTEAFRERLLSIRQREAELRDQATELRRREQAVKHRERQIRQEVVASATVSNVRNSSQHHHQRRQLPQLSNDDSSLSIEPNEDTTILAPTVAKFDSNVILRPKAFTMIRAAKDSSSTRDGMVINRDVLSDIPPPLPARNNRRIRPVSTGASYSQQELAEAVTKALQGGDTRPKCTNNDLLQHHKGSHAKKQFVPLPRKLDEPSKFVRPQTDKVTKTATTLPATAVGLEDIPNRWTDVTKRTAFAMLAAMNANNQRRPFLELQATNAMAAGADETIVDDVLVNDRVARHDRKRQSMMVVMLRPGTENIVPMTRL